MYISVRQGALAMADETLPPTPGTFNRYFQWRSSALPKGAKTRWWFIYDFRTIRQPRLPQRTGITTRPAAVQFDSIQIRSITVPFWALVILTLPYPLWFFLAPGVRRKNNRLAANACVRCGYDLRASPDRCPECGAVPTNELPEALPSEQVIRMVRLIRLVSVVLVITGVGAILVLRWMAIEYQIASLQFLVRWK